MLNRLVRVGLLSALACFLTFASARPILCEPSKSLSDDYAIGPEDVLDIVVLKDANLTKVIPVDKDGYIALAYLKKIKVSGLTSKAVAEFISGRLKAEGYIVDPKVTVTIKEYRSQKVMVFGLVKSTGEVILKGKTRALDLVNQITNRQEVTDAQMTITRSSPSGKDTVIPVDLQALIMDGDLSQDIEILDGDNIVIAKKQPKDKFIASDDYIIASDDVLDINVWRDNNLTKIVTVDKDGNITLPYLNKVAVSGQTPKAAAELIAERLKKEGYLVSPQVTVIVKEYLGQKVTVFGLVRKPGFYFLKGKTYVLDLLSQVESNEGSGGKMVIMRKAKPSSEEELINVDLRALLLNGDLAQNIQILAGDHIIISRISTGQQIYVLGEVRNPGPYSVERDLSVLETLRMAGGFTDFANQGKIKIIREENGKKRNIYINLNKIKKGDKKEDISLRAGDVLVALKSWF